MNQVFEQEFPAIALRYKACADTLGIKPLFGYFFNFCLNAPRPVDAVVLVTNIQQVLHISSVLLPAVKRDLVELFHSSWWSGNFTMTWICCRPIIPIIKVTEAQFTKCCLCCTTILPDIAHAVHQLY